MTAPLLPRDARLISLILAAAGAEDWEDGVVRMLVEFAHRYTTDILTDSLMYAEHARSGQGATSAAIPSLDDLRLAVNARTDGATVPKEFLLNLATTVNAVPLPPVPEVYGIRLPPAANRLTAPNFTLAPRSTAPAVDADAGPASESGQDGEDAAGEDESEGLFGDDDDDDEDEDEEMEDVTFGGDDLNGGMSDGGQKRKAGDSDEEYD